MGVHPLLSNIQLSKLNEYLNQHNFKNHNFKVNNLIISYNPDLINKLLSQTIFVVLNLRILKVQSQ